MKNKNDFRVQMIKVEGDMVPFVKVEYVDLDANEQTALMVIDSCSTSNIIIGKRAERNGVVLQKEEGTMNIGGAGNEMVTTSLAKFHFVLGGEQFHESFCINDSDIQIPMAINGTPIIGILGNVFMLKYRLAINYSDFTLHTSNISQADLPVSACDFYFPMEIGLKKYGLPLLAIIQDGNEIMTLADTGATNNMIASQSITENGIDCRYLDSTGMVAGITGKTEVKNAIIKFCLLTQTEDSTDVIDYEDIFKVTPHYFITPSEGQCDKDGVQLPPVVGIIGSPFMAKEGWVLDFGIKSIYKKKAPNIIDMDIRIDTNILNDGKNTEPKYDNKRRSIRFFVDATEKGMPFIRINEGNFKGIVMLIDTGSNKNSLFGYAYHQLEDLLEPIEEQCNVHGIDGTIKTFNCTCGTFTFCGKEYEMDFMVVSDNKAATLLSERMGFPVAGIIGAQFLVEHGWMIDFCNQEVVIPPSDISSSDWAAIMKRK